MFHKKQLQKETTLGEENIHKKYWLPKQIQFNLFFSYAVSEALSQTERQFSHHLNLKTLKTFCQKAVQANFSNQHKKR